MSKRQTRALRRRVVARLALLGVPLRLDFSVSPGWFSKLVFETTERATKIKPVNREITRVIGVFTVESAGMQVISHRRQPGSAWKNLRFCCKHAEYPRTSR